MLAFRRFGLAWPLTLSLSACGPGAGGSGESSASSSASETEDPSGETLDDEGESASDEESGTPTDDGGDDGPWAYEEIDEEGRFVIDHLYMFTPEAVAELEAAGETPESWMDGQLDGLNEVLERSLISSSRVRSLGRHLVLEEDFERTENWPLGTNDNLGFAYGWLDDYRNTYGADKIMIIAGTQESGDGFNWGGGDGSSYYIEFAAINHEIGHTMGGSHCNDGAEGFHFGMPLAGYDAMGFPNATGLEGGTTMCGNSAAVFSNPDIELTLEEIADWVEQGILPDQDYEAQLGAGGTLAFGDPLIANMAQTWRDLEESAARRIKTARYPGYEEVFYENDDCAAFYAGNGYHNFLYELCAGDETQPEGPLAEVSSVKLGRRVHVNLYSDPSFGAESSCGGIRHRLAFSTPSIEALSLHREVESMDDLVASATVYAPEDRQAHARFEGPFRFYTTSEPPYCSTLDGETLTLMRDNLTWSQAAAVNKGSFEAPYTISFDYRSFHEDEEGTPPADGMVVFFGKDGAAYESANLGDASLGFITDGSGYGVMFNMWTNQVALRDGAFADVGESVGMDTYTDGAWVPVRIEVGVSSASVYWNDELVLTRDITHEPGLNSVGLSSGTGAYASEFSVRGFSVVSD